MTGLCAGRARLRRRPGAERAAGVEGIGYLNPEFLLRDGPGEVVLCQLEAGPHCDCLLRRSDGVVPAVERFVIGGDVVPGLRHIGIDRDGMARRVDALVILAGLIEDKRFIQIFRRRLAVGTPAACWLLLLRLFWAICRVGSRRRAARSFSMALSHCMQSGIIGPNIVVGRGQIWDRGDLMACIIHGRPILLLLVLRERKINPVAGVLHRRGGPVAAKPRDRWAQRPAQRQQPDALIRCCQRGCRRR